MAGKTETEKPNVRTAEADPKAEIFEVEIPEGLEVHAPGDEPAVEADEPEVLETPEPEPKGKAKAAKPADKPPHDRLPASTREEREKRKRATKLWEETAAERDRLEAELRARRGQAPVTATMSKEYVASLKERANKAETMGDLLEIMLEEQAKRDTQWAGALNEERFNRHLQISETIARHNPEMPGYDLVLKEAGILAAVKVGPDGQFGDPAIARKIYTDPNPGRAAYDLAVGKLEKDGRLDAVLETLKPQSKAREVELDDEPEPEKPAAKGKAVPQEVDAAGERRAGAREVIEKVGEHSSRPRGLQAVKASAPPKRGMTRQDLDRMADEDPNGLDALFTANPKLKVWWLGGVEAAG